jgi:hypothetical protein
VTICCKGETKSGLIQRRKFPPEWLLLLQIGGAEINSHRDKKGRLHMDQTIKGVFHHSSPRSGFWIALLFYGAAAALAKASDTESALPNLNTADGSGALFSLTSGVWNTAFGFRPLYHNTTGSYNTALGVRALVNNTTGSNNTATGVNTLYSNTTGSRNLAVGQGALQKNTSKNDNTAVGFDALMNNTDSGNTAVGSGALQNATTSGGFGSNSNAFGYQALFSQTTGRFNSGFGNRALYNNQTGWNNTAVGYLAGDNITGGNNVCIGAGVSGVAGENSTTRISNIAITPIPSGGVYVYADGSKIGYFSSSRRWKDQIEPIDTASEAIYALKPVSFRGKPEADPSRSKQFGLIAEDVEKANPDLVGRDEKGDVATVRYDSINAMLLNEFLKEHRKVQELEAAVARQEKTMELLAKALKAQGAQIQKVSAQLATSGTIPQVAANE